MAKTLEEIGTVQTEAQLKKKSKLKYNWRAGYGMLIPSFILLILFMYYPAMVAIGFSFTNWDGFNPPQFTGLQNYISLLTDKVFWISMRNVSIWAIVKSFIELFVPLFVSVVIFHLKSKRMQYIYRVLFVIPVVVPGIVMFMIWSFIYDPNVGVLNALLHALGLGHFILNWLGSSKIALISLMFVGFPFVVPFNLLIFFAGLQNISESVYESARLDGITRFQRFFKLEVPLVLGQVKLILILTIIQLLQNVTLPLVMTNGGPGYSSYVPGLYMYFLAFQNGQFGLGMAVSMIIFIIVLILTWIQMKYINPSTEYKA
ncbi:sugar ABC transporter permease [Pullulanibacillus sp. KACC 23026]|uniref:carbohydrate ABC transporter permease n=1 Tax=Pullulanibacillus sp. KACC 23026 TaxID=3028315 RepID=UPI0023B1A704|nr:sugar ABC transporter permease [Pullulanibacillus sp. KACC 23026]WEG11065.1 sugar ABC transporter permease [Pullulanibacillus sp. KACC 23026]